MIGITASAAAITELSHLAKALARTAGVPTTIGIAYAAAARGAWTVYGVGSPRRKDHRHGRPSHSRRRDAEDSAEESSSVDAGCRKNRNALH